MLLSLAANNFSKMDSIMDIVESGSSGEITYQSIDEKKLKEYQSKCCVWDYHSMTKECFLEKTQAEKKTLILQYYIQMLSGKNISLLFHQ